MIPEGLLLHTVTVIEPAVTTDARNIQVLDYGSAATRTEIRARVQQDQRSETFDDGRTPAVELWTLFANVNGLLTTRSRIEWTAGGLTFEVHGQPEPTYDATAFHHIEATLRIAEG